ncbi:type 1 glutamine amidotransferase [Rhizobium sp.]
MTRRIAILLTSTDMSDFARRHPDDGQKFTTLLQPLRPDWRFDVVSVKDGVFPTYVEDYDGYVITGSPASVNGPEDWVARLMSLIREIEARRIPMFGACFGHQAIAVALGGSVTKSDKGWGLGTAPTHFDRQAPWMKPFRKDLVLFAAHQEQVDELPDGAEILGGDAHCPIGAYRIGDHVFATEYHPEMTHRFIAELLDELDGKLDAETLAKARDTLETPAEGPFFARWIVNFLEYRAPK